jgi:hypothetical protein
MEAPKKPYTKPRLVEYGTVSELTLNKGKSFETDIAFTGSVNKPL